MVVVGNGKAVGKGWQTPFQAMCKITLHGGTRLWTLYAGTADARNRWHGRPARQDRNQSLNQSLGQSLRQGLKRGGKARPQANPSLRQGQALGNASLGKAKYEARPGKVSGKA